MNRLYLISAAAIFIFSFIFMVHFVVACAAGEVCTNTKDDSGQIASAVKSLEESCKCSGDVEVTGTDDKNVEVRIVDKIRDNFKEKQFHFGYSAGSCTVNTNSVCGGSSCSDTSGKYPFKCFNSTHLAYYGCTYSSSIIDYTCNQNLFDCTSLNSGESGKNYVCSNDACVPKNPCVDDIHGTTLSSLHVSNQISGYDYVNRSTYWNQTLSGNITSVCFYTSKPGIVNYTIAPSPASEPVYNNSLIATQAGQNCADNLNFTWPYTSAYLSRYIPGSCGGTPNSCTSILYGNCNQISGCTSALASCQGTPIACGSISSATDCSSVPYCSWKGPTRELEAVCVGTAPTSCKSESDIHGYCGYGCTYYPCGGVPDACSTYKDYQTCPNQPGCSWNPSTAVAYTAVSCLGQAESCSSITSNSSCQTQSGCSWILSNTCYGTPSPTYSCASFYDSTSCSSHTGCTWHICSGRCLIEGGGDYCGGTQTACSSYASQSSCSAQSGCTWSSYVCNGTATSCSSYPDMNTCYSQSGCYWPLITNGNSYIDSSTPEPKVDRWQSIIIDPLYNVYTVNNANSITGYDGGKITSWSNVKGNTLAKVCFKINPSSSIINAAIGFNATSAYGNSYSGIVNGMGFGICGWYCGDFFVPWNSNSLELNRTSFVPYGNTAPTGVGYTNGVVGGNALNNPSQDIWQAVCMYNGIVSGAGQTIVTINPNYVFPGQSATVTVNISDTRYAGNHKVYLDLSIDGTPWSDCNIAFVNLTAPSPTDTCTPPGCIYWNQGTNYAISSDGNFSIQTVCKIPVNTVGGTHVLTVIPTVYSSPVQLQSGTTKFTVQNENIFVSFWNSFLKFLGLK